MNFSELPFLAPLERWLAALPDAIVALCILALFIAAAVGVHGLLYRLLLPRVAKGSAVAQSLFRRARSLLRLALILLSLIVALPLMDLRGRTEDAVEHVALVLLIALIGWTLIVLSNHLTERTTRRRHMDAEDNLRARKYVTQVRVVNRVVNIIIGLVTGGAVLLTFDGVQEYGLSLFASAGAAGLILGLAARPVLANMIAGLQIAITQPIRLEDVVVIEGEWGWIEEIFATYVVVRVWDRRRLVVPLSYFIEQPFQNWTRETAQVIGVVTWDLDYTVPVRQMREKLDDFLEESDLWDRDVANLQVVETGTETVTIRALMTARTSPRVWDLRCEVREKMLEWLRAEYPAALPRRRTELRMADDRSGEGSRASI